MNENTETPTARTGPVPAVIEPPPEPAPSWGRNVPTGDVVRTIRAESTIVQPTTAEPTPADRTTVDGGVGDEL